MCVYHGGIRVLLTLALLQQASCTELVRRESFLVKHAGGAFKVQSPKSIPVSAEHAASVGPVGTFGKEELCFCAMAGHCGDVNNCAADADFEACQSRVCQGEEGNTDLQHRDTTSLSSSFFNIQDNHDILTIPREYFEDIRGIVPNGEALLESLLEAGRRVFTEEYPGTTPEYQCIHQPGCVSVHWLHVHTFIGRVEGEALPSTVASAACAFVNMTVSAAAQQILGQARADDVCPADNLRELLGRWH